VSDGKVLAICSDYLGFIAALRDRAADLGLAMGSENAAEISGLAGATLARLMTPKTSGKILSIESFGVVLGLLGVKMLVVEDEAQTIRMKTRIVRRNPGYVRDQVTHLAIPKETYREMGRKGGKIRKERIGAKRCSKSARHAALIRHSGGPASIRSYNARAAALARWAKYRGDYDGAQGLKARPAKAD
jgi:hypothetical protein